MLAVDFFDLGAVVFVKVYRSQVNLFFGSLVAFRQRHENAGGILFFFAFVDFDFGFFGGFFGFCRFGPSGQAARYAENRGKNERNERKISDHCFRQAFQRVLQDVGKRAVRHNPYHARRGEEQNQKTEECAFYVALFFHYRILPRLKTVKTADLAVQIVVSV